MIIEIPMDTRPNPMRIGKRSVAGIVRPLFWHQ
jgi:hypothetical protein